ncbi:MAG TPA: flavodoxin-dependent (E)-4-hydroxy-3-methylbut-2-enyl-diphosphate synthase [Coriobacteriaceae bacterium]|nr:flavodoxin-dependent (E)-4-hydroxy-3-methylbut-2-enyl-diphosphate synthase [Coriobacteriaceae bacterium]
MDFETPRNATRRVHVGKVAVGGGAPVSVQSMTNIPMIDGPNGPWLDVEGNLAQIERLAKAGCEIVRVAIPNRASIARFGQVAEASPLPVVADVHFDYQIAVGACHEHAAGLRINPGNIGAMNKVDAVIEAAGEAGIPIRIGVNAGSLEDALAARSDLTQAEKLALSAEGFVEHFRERDFDDIVVSAKAHDVMTTVNAYRSLSRSLPEVPLHIGVTEAGGVRQGTIKSAAGLGMLLAEGIGDTMRVSLTADPVEEIAVAFDILSAVDVRRCKPEIVSCPTCSRCQVDLIPIADEVTRRLAMINKPLKVAVMGCVVNGPGEARFADVGVACGRDEGVLFAKGEKLRRVPADAIVDELFALIETL